MSVIISIDNTKKVKAKTAVKQLLKEKGIRIYKHPFVKGPINYGNRKLYVPGKSTRGVLINKGRIGICQHCEKDTPEGVL
jgi:hypothetical protein